MGQELLQLEGVELMGSTRDRVQSQLKVHRYNRTVNDISTAIVEEGFTLIRHNAETVSKHLVFECLDDDQFKFKLTYARTPSKPYTTKILRAYARQGYQSTLHLKTTVVVAVEGTVKSCKTQVQLVFEEQCGKLQRQYVQGLLEQMR